MGDSGNTPILSLRMNHCRSGLSDLKANNDGGTELLDIMVVQDKKYMCRDYLRRRKRDGHNKSDNDCPPLISEEMVDEVCREKMCEWSYRVCDHFQTNREIVAFAFSFLDRFIDRCSCDRTAFKLAAMTSLYMATKMLNLKQISITGLAELSRGEFEVAHIAEMERIILETLEWRMNPPTAQSFINELRVLLPNDNDNAMEGICARAFFFAELCIYDYSFATESRYLVAVACILNAIEGMDNTNRIYEMKLDFFSRLDATFNTSIDRAALQRAQARLWYLYSCSAQAQHDDILPTSFAQERLEKYNYTTECTTHSPVSVEANGRF